jgi:hypothetical protein
MKTVIGILVAICLLVPVASLCAEEWTRKYDYPGQQEDENRQRQMEDLIEQQKNMAEQKAYEERKAARERQRQEQAEMNNREEAAPRSGNPARFNHGQPLQQRTGPESVRPSWSRPARSASPTRGAINPRTGEYLPPSKDGVINPRTGEFYPPSGKGYVNPRTGEFMPKTGP